ncbi:SDR family NAD(P)-dependent oxidoreductase [Neobacillus sp. NPDC093182]|uniref:SDR family NAD(P)-dependent oxidoreductase n=1 Tax=Neobacillus sp. NPDC093182 TaxID=3364297 RepID=UPI0038048066
MGKRLDGKVTIITGAASGFGRAMVKGFSKEGARIFAIDIDESVEKLIEEVDGEFIHLKQTYLTLTK